MEYLIGMGLFGLVWLGFYLARPDVRKAMVWSGGFYVVVMSAGFVAIKILWPDMPAENTVVPGYWNPDTLFNLGRITGGYAIEDALYGFFTGGVAAAVYEELFRKHLGHRHIKHRPHIAVTLAAIAGFGAVSLSVNLIWSLIAFGFVGAFVIWLKRRDLIWHSIYGGFSYLLVYIGFFLVFNAIFPHFVPESYSLHNFLGPMPLGIPIEEYLFALSFGLMWSPIYEYMKDVR